MGTVHPFRPDAADSSYLNAGIATCSDAPQHDPYATIADAHRRFDRLVLISLVCALGVAALGIVAYLAMLSPAARATLAVAGW